MPASDLDHNAILIGLADRSQYQLTSGAAAERGDDVVQPFGTPSTDFLQVGLVIITGDIDGALSATSAAARIGAATSAYAVGERCLFVVDNGDGSSVYLFAAATADAAIDAAELTLLSSLVGTGSTALADCVFG